MPWKGRRQRDPLLVTAAYRAARRYWKQLALPCARCGRPINYDAPHLIAGKLNPWAYQLGHKVGRTQARRLGWTDEQINAIANTQPEHQRCNHLAGIKAGHKTQKVRAQRRKVANTSREWCMTIAVVGLMVLFALLMFNP